MISQRVLSLIAAFVLAHPAWADYPEKPVKIVVGFTPGGGPDIIARYLAPAADRHRAAANDPCSIR